MEPLLKRVLDEIALEGFQGCTLPTLWKLVEAANMGQVDEYIKAAIWNALCTRNDLEFFHITGVIPPVLQESGWGTSFVTTRRDVIPRDSLPTLDELKIPADKLCIVASVDARALALGVTREIATKMARNQYAFLELIAQRRAAGLKQRELAKMVGLLPKHIFHTLKALDLKYQLITRMAIMDTSSTPHTPTVLLTHVKFAKPEERNEKQSEKKKKKKKRGGEEEDEDDGEEEEELEEDGDADDDEEDDDDEEEEGEKKKKRKKDDKKKDNSLFSAAAAAALISTENKDEPSYFFLSKFMERISSLLDSARDKVLTTHDLKKFLRGHACTTSRRLATQRFTRAKRQLISRGCVEEFRTLLLDSEKEKHCLRLLKPYVAADDDGADEASDEESQDLFYTYEHSTLYSFYRLIEASGTTGVSQGEIYHMRIGDDVDRKALLRRLDVLVNTYGVVRVADVTSPGPKQRRTMTYRLFTAENVPGAQHHQQQQQQKKQKQQEEDEEVNRANLMPLAEAAKLGGVPDAIMVAPSASEEGGVTSSSQPALAKPHATTLPPSGVTRKRPVTTLEKKRLDILQAHIEKVKVALSSTLRSVLSPDTQNPLDSKTLRRLIESLKNSSAIVIHSAEIHLLSGQVRPISLVCVPSLKKDDPLVQDFIRQLQDEEGCTNTYTRSPAPPVRLEKGRLDVDRLSSVLPASSQDAEVNTWLSMARKNGYIRPIMIRLKLLHQLLCNEFLFQHTPINPDETPQVRVVMSAVLERMPLQLFLQVLGHARPIDQLDSLIAQGVKIKDLNPSIRTDLFTKRAPEHHLRRLLDPLHRLRLIAPARSAPATVGTAAAAAASQGASQGEVQLNKHRELQVPGGELLLATKATSSCGAFVFSSREQVQRYWIEFESFCKSHSSPQDAPERTDLPEAFEPRNWAFHDISPVQRNLLVSQLPRDAMSRDDLRVAELARVTNLSIDTVWRFVEAELERQKKRQEKKKKRQQEEEEEQEEEEAAMTSEEESHEEKKKTKKKKKKQQQQQQNVRWKNYYGKETMSQVASGHSSVPVSSIEMVTPGDIQRQVEAEELSPLKKRGSRAKSKRQRAEEKEEEAEDDEETQQSRTARASWSSQQDARLVRLVLENSNASTQAIDWKPVSKALARPSAACMGRWRSLFKLPQVQALIDLTFHPKPDVVQEMPASLELFHEMYQVTPPTPLPPTPRQQLMRDVCILTTLTPDTVYSLEKAAPLLSHFPKEANEAWDWLRHHGHITRGRLDDRNYRISRGFLPASRLPSDLVAECGGWHTREQQDQLPLPLDAYASGGCVAATIEQVFAATAAAFAATIEKEKEKEPELSISLIPPQQASLPSLIDLKKPRLPLHLPDSTPFPTWLRFEAPQLEVELQGELLLAQLSSLYRTAERAGVDGVTEETLSLSCAPLELQPLLQHLLQRLLLIRVVAYSHPRYVARQHARPWFLIVPDAPPTLVRPWRQLDGAVCVAFYEQLQLRLFSAILRAPGITLDGICEQIPGLAPQHLADVIDTFVTADIVHVKPYEVAAATLFSSPVTKPCYFPSPAALTIYAQCVGAAK